MARILVADDASFMRQMIREIVEAQGHEVVGEASDGDEVVEAPLVDLPYEALCPGSAALGEIMARHR